MPKLVWLNGETMALESATVPVADHAHLYGDGLFEGIRIYGSKVFKLDEHLTRLYHGCRYLGFNMTIPQPELNATILRVCAEAGLADGYIRLNVTRGNGLGLDPKYIDNKPNVMIMVNTLALFPPEMYTTGLSAVTSPVRVIPSDALDPRLKCIGRYAGNILAKYKANQVQADEAMMLNHRGELTECTGENIFLVSGNVLKTPHPSCGILEGITRNTIMEIAKQNGFSVQEDFLTPFDVFTASECFLTGTAAELISLVSLDGRLIGDGKPGPASIALRNLFLKEVQNGTPF